MRVAITGAHSFTGRYVAQILLNKGHSIINLTNHPQRPWKLHSDRITDLPLTFKPEHLIRSLEGCHALVQTYWVRFDNTLGNSRQNVTNNSRMLIDCARKAGVQKIVYTSHTQTSIDSPFPYISEKSKVEQHLRESGISYGIVKPCAIFGRTPQQSILINNIAYLVRKFPFYPVPGDGNYALQFVHAQDMAELIVSALQSKQNMEVDAVGPEKVTFRQIIEHCAKEMNTTCKVIPHFSEKLLLKLTSPLNWYFDDILMDEHDLSLMTTGLTCSHDPPTGKRSFLNWISENKDELGREWISSIKRYYK